MTGEQKTYQGSGLYPVRSYVGGYLDVRRIQYANQDAMSNELRPDDVFSLEMIDKALKITKEHRIKACECKKCGKSYYVVVATKDHIDSLSEEDKRMLLDECDHEF